MLTIDQRRTVVEKTIEAISKPDQYRFIESDVREGRGCILAWMTHYARDIVGDESAYDWRDPAGDYGTLNAIAREVAQMTEIEFYTAMEETERKLKLDGTLATEAPAADWHDDGAVAAIVLREWYWSHPELSPAWLTDRGAPPVDDTIERA